MDPGLQLKLLMVGLWLLMVYRFYRPTKNGLESLRWEKVDATVILSSFDRFQNIYQPKIVYRYCFDGKSFDNDTYSFLGTTNLTKNSAIKLASSHSEGSNIQVYVSPSDGQQSVIVPGVHWSQWVSMVFLSFILLGIAYIVEILNFIWPGCAPACT
jgi:hypothetical protein